MPQKKITTSKSSDMKCRAATKRSMKPILASSIARSSSQKNLTPFILLVSGIALFSFFSIASAQGQSKREQPQCNGVVECSSLFFQSLWQTLTNQPIQQTHASSTVPPPLPPPLAPLPPQARYSAASSWGVNPLILQPGLSDNVGIGMSSDQSFPAYKLDVLGDIHASGTVFSSSIGIGTISPNTSALLDMTSTNQGFLPPRMTTAQMNAISTPPEGLTVYNTDSDKKQYQVWNGSAWDEMGGGLWKKIGTTKDIYYGEGRVGIGTTTPGASLEVAPKSTELFVRAIRGTKVVYPNTGTNARNYGVSVGDLITIGSETRKVVTISEGYMEVDTIWTHDTSGFLSGYEKLIRTKELVLNAGNGLYVNNGGYVGIGTAAPDAKLTIIGGVGDPNYNTVGLKLVSSGPGWGSGIQFNNTTKNKTYGIYAAGWDDKWHFGDVTNSVDRLVIDSVGNIGIGTDTPGASLQIAKTENVTTGPCVGNSDWNFRTLESNVSAIKFFDDPAGGCGDTAYIAYKSRGSTDKTALIIGNANDSDDHILLKPSGNVGIGNSDDPQFKLDVEGDVNVRTPLALGKMDNHQKLAFAKERIGFDVAELFDTEESVNVGNVLVVGSNERMLKKSSKPYQGTIIGVVSGAPAILFEGSQLKMGTSQKGSDHERKPAVALTGKVPVKVSLENGTIEVGDYLTTSSTPGFAMKATKNGMTLGIALENYNGTGSNEVLTFLSIKEASTSDIIEKLLNRIEKLEKSLKKK